MTRRKAPPDAQKSGPSKAAARLTARLRETQRDGDGEAAPKPRSLWQRVLIRIANVVLWFIFE